MAKGFNSRKIKAVFGNIAAVILIIIGVILKFSSSDDVSSDSAVTKAKTSGTKTEVHFVDVGQGDATLVINGEKTMLIDTGDTDTEDRLIAYMKEKGITRLDYLIITHPHADHMGEAKDVLKNFPTQKIIMPKLPSDKTPTNFVYQKFLKEVNRQNLKITAAKDDSFSLGDCNIQTFTPKKNYENLNNYSTIVKITDGKNKFLITGDCEKEEENDLLSQKFNLEADVLKAGHHGSYTSSSKKFLDKVSPGISVISCGEDNKYGHPHKETVNRLKKISQVYITKDDGSVIITSDGIKLSVNTEK